MLLKIKKKINNMNSYFFLNIRAHMELQPRLFLCLLSHFLLQKQSLYCDNT